MNESDEYDIPMVGHTPEQEAPKPVSTFPTTAAVSESQTSIRNLERKMHIPLQLNSGQRMLAPKERIVVPSSDLTPQIQSLVNAKRIEVKSA